MLLVCNQKPALMRAIEADQPRSAIIKKRPAIRPTGYIEPASREILKSQIGPKKKRPATVGNRYSTVKASRDRTGGRTSIMRKGEIVGHVNLDELPIFKDKNKLGIFTMKLFGLDPKKYKPTEVGVSRI